MNFSHTVDRAVPRNLVHRACDPREGTRGSGIIRFREESDWSLIWNAQFNLSQDSWPPATDYPEDRTQARGTRLSPSEKGGTAYNTSRNEIRPLFALVKLAPPLHKHYLYPINLSNRNR
jgi:hypothetical protein